MKIKKIIISIAMAVLAASGVAQAQTVYEADPLFDAQFRAAIKGSHKFFNLVTLTLEEEGRSQDMMASCRNYSTVDINFDLNKYFNAGFGYTFIYQTPNARHRGYIDLIGIYETGNWTFSLKERVQMTHKVYEVNNYNMPRNLVELKSCIKAQYAIPQSDFRPYASFEVKNVFNGVKYPSYSTFRPTEYSYNDIYINRLRTIIGTEWQFAKHEILDFYLLYDYGYDRIFDVESSTLRFHSITNQFAHTIALGVCLWFKI